MSPTIWFRRVSLSALVLTLAMLVISQPDAPAREGATGKKYALLVGVTKYDSGKFATLKYTEADVEDLAAILLDKDRGGFDSVRVLTNARGAKADGDKPTAANIRKEIEAIVKKKKEGDTVLVAFSGHGVQMEVRDPDAEKTKNKPNNYTYFCPVDADLTDKFSYSTGKCDSFILMKEIFDPLNNCGAKRKLVLLDACRNEYQAEKVSRSLDLDDIRVPDGIAAMFSCGSGQKAYETSKYGHGVFFHFVLEGLRGNAKQNKGGEVTWDHLVAYVREEVSEAVPTVIGGGAEQRPQIRGSLSLSPPLARVGKAKLASTLRVKDGDFDMELLLIPACKDGFKMGSTDKEQDAAIADSEKITGSKASDNTKAFYRAEGPQHLVKLKKPFYLGKFEVTQKQYKAIMGENPSYFSKDGKGKDSVKDIKDDELAQFPVENVSWEDAQKFLDKLKAVAEKQKIQFTFRLPTEAEWEYSCRGGPINEEPFNLDGKPSKSISSSQANFDGNYPFGGADKGKYLERPCAVDSSDYKPNKFGLYHMHGNVYEWCHDAYDPKAYDAKGRTDPSVSSKEDGAGRVIRGGGWDGYGQSCRAAFRSRDSPSDRYFYLGFRVAAVPR